MCCSQSGGVKDVCPPLIVSPCKLPLHRPSITHSVDISDVDSVSRSDAAVSQRGSKPQRKLQQLSAGDGWPACCSATQSQDLRLWSTVCTMRRTVCQAGHCKKQAQHMHARMSLTRRRSSYPRPCCHIHAAVDDRWQNESVKTSPALLGWLGKAL